jgi:hypothetical protein
LADYFKYYQSIGCFGRINARRQEFAPRGGRCWNGNLTGLFQKIAAPHNEKAVNTQYLAFLSRHCDVY